MNESPREIVLPADALLVLIGPAGCGKSTFAAARFLPTQTVSSDECRALVSDDEANVRVSKDAFALMHTIVDMRLKRGRLTVADATNVSAEKRGELLAIAERHRRPAVALVFDLPLAVCLERNKARLGRVLPPPAIAGQAKRLREALPQLAREGFAEVWVLRTAEDAEGLGVAVRAR